jgi:hypothetical protein
VTSLRTCSWQHLLAERRRVSSRQAPIAPLQLQAGALRRAAGVGADCGELRVRQAEEEPLTGG